jgi:hypothetical protein
MSRYNILRFMSSLLAFELISDEAGRERIENSTRVIGDLTNSLRFLGDLILVISLQTGKGRGNLGVSGEWLGLGEALIKSLKWATLWNLFALWRIFMWFWGIF